MESPLACAPCNVQLGEIAPTPRCPGSPPSPPGLSIVTTPRGVTIVLTIVIVRDGSSSVRIASTPRIVGAAAVLVDVRRGLFSELGEVEQQTGKPDVHATRYAPDRESKKDIHNPRTLRTGVRAHHGPWLAHGQPTELPRHLQAGTAWEWLSRKWQGR